MTVAYKKISTATIDVNGSSSIVFNNIPQTYSDLLIVTSLRSGSGSTKNISITLNGQTSGISSLYLYGDGQNASAGGTDGGRVIGYSAPTSATLSWTNNYAYIPDYTSSKEKNISIDAALEQNQSNNALILSAMTWTGTSAITSISLSIASGLYAQHSTATLYGIRG